MKHKHTIQNILIGIVGVIVCLVVAALIAINTPWFRNYLRAEIGKLALENTGARVEIGSLSTHWTSFVFDLNNVIVYGRPLSANEPPLFKMARLEVGIRFLPLFHKRFELSSLILDQPALHVRIDSQGNSNLPVSPHSTASTSTPDQLFNLEIANCTINSGQIFYNDAQIPVDAQLHDLKLEAGYSALRAQYSGSLSYDNGRLLTRQLAPIDNAMQVQFSATRSGLSLSPLILTSGASRINLNARVANYQTPNITGTYSGNLSTAELASALHSTSLPIGNVALNGKLAYQAGQNRPFIAALNVQGQMQSDLLQFQAGQQSIAVTAVSTPYELKNAALQVPNLTANILGGAASVHLEMEHLDAPHATSRVQASLHGVSLASASSELASRNVRRIPLDGTTDLQLNAAWTGSIADTVARARLAIASRRNTASSQGIPVNGLITVAYDGPRDRISFGQSYVRTANTRLSIAGSLSSQKSGSSTVTLLATTSNLAGTVKLATMVQNAMNRSRTPTHIPSLAGSANLTVRATGSAKHPTIQGRLTAQNLAIDGSRWLSLAFNIDGNSSGISIQKGRLIAAGNSAITFGGKTGLHNWTIAPSSPIQFHTSVSHMSLANIQQIGQLNYPVTGDLSADISVAGTRSQPNGKARIMVTKASAWDEPISSLAIDAQSSGGTIQSTVDLQMPAGTASASGSYTPSTQQYSVNLKASGIKLAQIPPLQKSAPIQGTASLSASGSGTIHDPQLAAKLSIPQLQADGQTISGTEAQINIANQHARLELRSAVDKGSVSANGDIALTGDRYTTATVDVQSLPIGAIAGNVFSSQGSKFGGNTSIHLAASGPLKSPSQMQAHLRIPTLSLTYETAQIGLVRPLVADYTGGTLTIMPAEIKGPATDITFGGTVPVKSKAAFSLAANGSVDLAALQQFDPNVQAAGQITLHLKTAGQISKPTMQGQLRVVNAEFMTENFPLGLDDLNAQINLSGNRADIANFSGTVGGGKVSAHGFATIGHGSTFNLGMNAETVRLQYPEGMRSVLTAQLNFRGSTSSSYLTGRVLVDNLEFTKQLDLASFAGSFSTISTGGPPSPFESNAKVNIAVQSAQQISLASNKLSIGGSANLDVIGTLAQPIVLGRIALTNGEVFFLGKRFEIQSGTISFANPVRTEPVVQMYVSTRIEQYNITLNLTGPVDRLTTNYTSQPALPPADIIHLLAFGNTLEEASAQPSQGAAMGAESVLASGVGSHVAGKLENATGISQLTIDPLATSSSGRPGQQIGIQERVTGSLLFTFSTNVTTTQGQTVELQYDLNSRVSVTVLRDQNGGYGLDLRWHKVF